MSVHNPKALFATNKQTVVGAFGTNERYTATVTNATGGSITLAFTGQTGTGIGWSGTASAVQAILAAMTGLSGNVRCTGGPLNTAGVVIEMIGTLAGTDTSAWTIDGSGLTGGGTQTGTIALTTTGVVATASVLAPYTLTVPAGAYFNLVGAIQVVSTAIVAGTQYLAEGPEYAVYRTPSGGSKTLLATLTQLATASGIGTGAFDRIGNNADVDNQFEPGDVLTLELLAAPGGATQAGTGAVSVTLLIVPRN